MRGPIFRQYLNSLLKFEVYDYLRRRNPAWSLEQLPPLGDCSEEEIRRKLEALYRKGEFKAPVVAAGDVTGAYQHLVGVYPASTRDDFIDDLESKIGDTLCVACATHQTWIAFETGEPGVTHIYLGDEPADESNVAVFKSYESPFFRKNLGFSLIIDENKCYQIWSQELESYEEELQ